MATQFWGNTYIRERTIMAVRMPGGRGKTCLAVVLALSSVTCGRAESRPTATVTDSAGVTIVRSVAPTWGDGAEAVLSTSPRLDLITDVDDPGSVLYQVTGIAVIPDGRIALSNRGDGTVRLYDETGALLWKAGRPGDGPDEFRDLRGLVLRGNELWAFQTLGRPIKVFDLDGKFLRAVATPESSGPRIRGILADEWIVVTGRPQGSSTDRVFTQFASLVRFREGVTDTIGVVPSSRRVNLKTLSPEWQALGPGLHVAVSERRVYAGFSANWDIGVWDVSGRMVQRIQRVWDPVPVTSAHRAAYTETLIEQGRGDPRLEDAYRRIADEMAYPSSHPAHARIIVDATGVLWVERPQTEPPWSEGIDYNPVPAYPGKWDLFATDGAWLTYVAVPARFRVMDIGSDYVAGVAKNELDVERVQVWELHRPG